MASVASYELPEHAPLGEGNGLLPFFQAHRGDDLHISLARLRRLDTALLQILLAARRDWQKRGLNLSLCAVTEAKRAQLELLGIGPELLPILAGPKGQALPASSPSPLKAKKRQKSRAAKAET